MIFLLTTLLWLAAGSDKPALAPEFKEFLSWYQTYEGPITPQDVLKSYQERLTAQGVASAEWERRKEIVVKSVQAMPIEFTAIHFNKIYAMEDAPFTRAPNQLLVRIAEGLKPGTALDVAMGQGRNALYLARKGWQVTGYDISDGGLKIAQSEAAKAGLKIETVRASHDEFDYGKQRWDLIVESYAFTNLADEAYRRKLVDALKPGGVLLIDGFGGGPKNQMLEGFKDLRVIYYEDREDIADWSMKKARVARLVAAKE